MILADVRGAKSAHKTAKPRKNINYALHFCNKCHKMFSFCFVVLHSRQGACLLPAFLPEFNFCC